MRSQYMLWHVIMQPRPQAERAPMTTVTDPLCVAKILTEHHGDGADAETLGRDGRRRGHDEGGCDLWSATGKGVNDRTRARQL